MAIIEVLKTNTISFSVDRSYFLEKSVFISAHMIITLNQIKLGIADFISTVAPRYCSTYTAELYSTLAVYFIMEFLILKYPDLVLKQYSIFISLDSATVLSFLSSLPKMIPITSSLYQIKEEINRIQTAYNIGTNTYKMKAYQDEKVSRSHLSFLEKVNIICDEQVKCLIQ